ncbi:MAG TPA: S8 family serine peptidase, partial [Bacteroidales bacterium]
MKSWDNFIFNNSLFLIFALFTCSSFAQEKLAPGIYLIRFTDKNSNQYQLSQPESFLSPRALLRRHQQQIVLKNNDLPVSALYIDSLRKLGFTILNSSKWHNAVTVLVSDTSIFRKLDNVSFVKPYVKSKSIITPSFPSNKLIANYSIVKSQLTDFYGLSYDQIAIHHGDFLHSLGYQGQGMLIAVIDAGFNNAQNMSCFDTLWMENRVSLERDTYNPNASVFTEDSHGSEVLSTMAATFPGNLVGTAPKANYLLLRSENATYEANGRQYEYPVEEFNWTVAAELADSIGADIISTSLGYSQFNDSTLNHTYKDMNGHTTLVSIGASIAASKGMIVVVSAGNEGAN